MSSGATFPTVTFHSELQDGSTLGATVYKEFEALCGQIEGILRAVGVQADGTLNNLVTNNITIVGDGTITTVPPTTPGNDGGGTGSGAGAGGAGGTPFTGAAPGDNTDIIFNDNGNLGADPHLTFDKVIQQFAMRTEAVAPAYQSFVLRAGSDEAVLGFWQESQTSQIMMLGMEYRAGGLVARATDPCYVFNGVKNAGLYQVYEETPGSPLAETKWAVAYLTLSGGQYNFNLDSDTHVIDLACSGFDLTGNNGADYPNSVHISVIDSLSAGRALGIQLGDTNRTIVFDASGFVKWV